MDDAIIKQFTQETPLVGGTIIHKGMNSGSGQIVMEKNLTVLTNHSSTSTKTVSSLADQTTAQEKVMEAEEQKRVVEYHGKHVTSIIAVSKRGKARVHARGARRHQPLLTSTSSSSDDDPRRSSRGVDARVHRRFRARRKGRRQITYVKDALDHSSDVSSGGEQIICSVGSGRFRFEQASAATVPTVCAYFRDDSKNMAKDLKQTEKEFSQQVTDVVQQTTLSRSDVAPRLLCTDNVRLTSAPDSRATSGNHFKTEACLDRAARNTQADSSQSDDFGSDFRKISEKRSSVSSGSRPTSSTTAFSEVFFHHTHGTDDNLGADANLHTEATAGWSQTGAARYPAFAAGNAPNFTASSSPGTSSLASISSGQGETSTTLVSTSESDKSLVSKCFNGVVLSDSEVGPLVSFSKPWLEVLRQGRSESDDTLAGGLSAQEIRRRYSADQYQPLSPFATHRRHASNLSEGAAPLFLHIQKRPPGPVRQLSLEIGEEWERVHSPRGLQSPAALPGGEMSDVDDVFVWPNSSTTDTIPMTVRRASNSVTSRKHSLKGRSHQTSAKLRRLYPRPGCCLPIKSSSSERTPGVTLPSRPWAGAQEEATTSAVLEQTTGSPTSTLPGSLVAAEEVESSISLYSGEETPSIAIMHPASTQSRGGCDHMAITIDDADSHPPSVMADHKRHLLPNPYNRLNQRCHSTLHCPCCFFLCLLCCLPAVYFMVLSDLEFDFGSLLKARRYGRRTTKLYFAGAALTVTLLVTCVVCVAFFLPHTLVGPRAG